MSTTYYNEDFYWKQKSRNKWLKEGERNTKFFHACAKTRKAKNMSVVIKDDHGVEKVGEENISSVATEYFIDLFATTNSVAWKDFFDYFPSSVTSSMNSQLTRSILDDKI